MDTYADDLAALIEALDLRDVTLVGFSTGGGEVARYIGRHGTGRVAQAVLVSAVPPFMLQTDDNPGGVPIEVFDGIRAGSLADRSQLYRDLADGPFFGDNRPGRERVAGHPRRVLAAGHAGRAPQRARVHRRVLRHRLPAGPRARSTSRRWSSTATTTRSCRSRSAARRRRR